MSLLDKTCQAILKMLKKKDERVLLWSNASPTSTFVAQTIALQAETYTAIEVVGSNVGQSEMYGKGYVSEKSILIGFAGNAREFYWDGRFFTLNSSGSVTFTDTRQTGWSGSAHVFAINNGACIPQKIYGIKSSGGGKLVNLFRKLLAMGGVRYGY